MNEYDALDAMIERAARQEQEELNRARGQFILDVIAAEDRRRASGEHPLLDAINRAHQAKAKEADK